MKRTLTVLLSLVLCFTLLASCAKESDPTNSPGSDPGNNPGNNPGDDPNPPPPGEIEDVHLRIWGDALDHPMLTEMIDAFVAANKDKVNLTYELGAESESTAKDTILTDIEAAADIFAFASDQLGELYAAGALQVISLNTDAVKAANAEGAVKAATMDGKLMAYPMTGDNGYFMYYNSEYFSEDDVKTLDGMLDVAQAAGKMVTMNMGDAWYGYSFFKGAGLDVYMIEGTQDNFCNWNGPGGTDVVQAMLDIAAHPAFISMGDDEFKTALADGSIIAGVNGPWNSGLVADNWGDNYAAAKMPTYTVSGSQVQMASFCGFKFLGVNAFTENPGWAMLLAEWLTSYDNQIKRFDARGQGPSNIEAGKYEKLKDAPALAAIAAQMPFSNPQIIGGNYWDPGNTLLANIVQGNPNNVDLQTLLDNAVAGITAPVG